MQNHLLAETKPPVWMTSVAPSSHPRTAIPFPPNDELETHRTSSKVIIFKIRLIHPARHVIIFFSYRFSYE